MAVVTHEAKYSGGYKIKRQWGLVTQGIHAWERIITEHVQNLGNIPNITHPQKLDLEKDNDKGHENGGKNGQRNATKKNVATRRVRKDK